MKHVSIIAATISGNRGAEAMLTTTIGKIRSRYPDCRFNIYTYYPEQDAKLVSDDKVQIFSATPLAVVSQLMPFSILFALSKLPRLSALQRRLPEAIHALDQSDVLIDLAGVAFIDGREKFLPYNILTLAPAFILNTPVIKFSQALGPFNNRLNRLLAKLTLRFCKQIFARGQGTFEHLQSLGLSNVFAAPVSDVAFLHQEKYSLNYENQHRLKHLANLLQAEQKPLIGICPSSVLAAKSLKDNSKYTASMTNLCQDLIKQGYAILLFPNATREIHPNQLRNNDLPVIKEIVGALNSRNESSDGIYAVDFDINTIGIKQLMSFCTTVLVSRFHAMIAALSAKQPVIVLGWSHKYKEVMDSFELGEFVYDFKQADQASILNCIKSIIDDNTEITAKLNRHHQQNTDSSSRQFEYLYDLLG